jgi:glutathione synthase/RimK-type ligase-like ATP-grasp enzyme
MATPRYVVIANPEGKRWQTYLGELAAFWAERRTRIEVQVVPWRVVVPRDGNLDGLTAFNRPALVRLESPGRDFEVTRLLLQAGARAAPHEAATDWLALPYQKGKLVGPRLLYQGFVRVLTGLRTAFNARPHLRLLACPLAIAELFDKNATSARLDAAGIPTPPSLQPPATSEKLLAALRARRFSTAYVKHNTGSSAAGIAVVHPLDPEPWCLSSVLHCDGNFYNSRRLCSYEGDDLHEVLGFLLHEGACVQRGIPMAQINGQNFDLRVVVIHGKPAFVVFRLSSQPMTNLHLGGRRGQFDDCRKCIPTRAWLDGLDHCAEAARLYDCAMVGVDLLFERGYLHHYILEANAFGDFFPGLTDATGRTAHRVEIEATAQHFGLLS